jgi:L-serine deaminase
MSRKPRNAVTTSGKPTVVAVVAGAVQVMPLNSLRFDYLPDEARRLARQIHAAADVLDPPRED